jgi:hypothetical protein
VYPQLGAQLPHALLALHHADVHEVERCATAKVAQVGAGVRFQEESHLR